MLGLLLLAAPLLAQTPVAPKATEAPAALRINTNIQIPKVDRVPEQRPFGL